jgi:hypothetical protein
MYYEIFAADDQISFFNNDALNTRDAASRLSQGYLDAAGRPPAQAPDTPSSTR